ncbi:MAG: hypothetical protein IKI13_03820 [Bacteroidales bacterium]|nr:hypothetical protein [Bacteroidales bacterium]
MKTLKFTFIIALAALALTSCDFFKPIIPVENRTHYYFLHIGFKDAAGNELIEPLALEYYKSDTSKPWAGEINPEEYAVDVVVPGTASGTDSIRVAVTASKFSEEYNRITPREDGTYGPDGNWFIDFRSIIINKNEESYSSLNYKFTCPEIFGDDSVHEISTTWAKNLEANGYSYYPACTKVVLDGKEYTPLRGVTYYQEAESMYVAYFVEVVLEQ